MLRQFRLRAALRTAHRTAPAGGLTVVSFANDHLQYALTWFALASMLPAGAWLIYCHRGSRAAPDLGN